MDLKDMILVMENYKGNLIYMLSQHPYHHMHLLFFLHSVLLLNNVFPKVPD